jgi:anaerobic C4-dicarboxylate transporter DcuA
LLVLRQFGKWAKSCTVIRNFLKKLKDPAFAKEIAAPEQVKERNIKPGAKISVIVFALGVLFIILVGSFPQILPSFGQGSANLSIDAKGNIKMAAMIEMIMLSAAAFMMITTKTTPAEVAKASLFSSGSAAVVAVFGVVWMSATFMDHNHMAIEAALGEMVKTYSWTFAIAMFILSMLLFSQAATVKVLMPLGVSLGISTPHLLAMFPAANGDFFLPGYPTLLAAINFDRTGTTKIGKYLLNHSFMRAGLVGVTVSVAAGFLIASIFF